MPNNDADKTFSTTGEITLVGHPVEAIDDRENKASGEGNYILGPDLQGPVINGLKIDPANVPLPAGNDDDLVVEDSTHAK